MANILFRRSMIQDEKKFIEQLNQKQMTAFRDLYDEYYRYLVIYATRYICDQDAAEDIVQEVIIAVWGSDKVYNSYRGLKAFLFDSVKNRCLNYLKHQEVEKRYLSEYMYVTDPSEDEFHLMREELYRELYQAMSELPERCRQVFELHLDGKKNEEIATLLHLSVLTVKTQKKKAVRYLKERFGKLYQILILLNIV